MRKVAFVLLLIITLLLAAATVADKMCGAPFAYDHYYNSWLMVTLWILMGISAAVVCVKYRKKMGNTRLWVHISLFIILIGAGVTHFTANEGYLDLSANRASTTTFTLKDGEPMPLPFAVTLRNCDVTYYPATTTPADYSATLLISSVDEPQVVAINKVVEVDSYRFNLTDISDDSCRLKVNYDPRGISLSYTGYILFALTALYYLLSPKRGYRAFIRRTLTVVALLLAIPAAGSETPKTLQKPLAANFGKLRVMYQGRVCPVSTLANDFCMAITGSTSYRGLTAEQVLTGWIFYYDSWKNEAMIRIKGSDLKELLKTDASEVSLKDFYRDGRFLPDNCGSLPSKNIADAVAKVDLISQVCTGSIMKIFPVESPTGDIEWVSWVNDMPVWLQLDRWKEIKLPIARFADLITHGHHNAANEVVTSINANQDLFLAAKNIDDHTRMYVERVYVKWGTPFWPLMAVLLSGVIVLVCKGLLRRYGFMVITSVAVIIIVAILSVRGYIGQYFPIAGGLETMLALALFTLLASLLLTRRHFSVSLAANFVALITLAVAMISYKGRAVGHLMPVLNSPLLSLHVLSVMLAYSLFAIMAVAAVVAIFSHRNCKSSTHLNQILLFPAVTLMGIGIFLGAIWANQSWGRYWGWDAKETWALITFFVYAFPLHGRTFKFLNTRRGYNLWLLMAFIAVLMTYFGVNYFMTGLHSYATA